MHYKFSLLAVFAGAALAQTPPDAGRTLQEQVPVIQAPKASRPVAVERAAPIGLAPGGLRAAIERVRIDGNTLFTEQQLLSLLGDIKAQSWDLAQLRQWAEQISDFYHQQGYRFAHAYVHKFDDASHYLIEDEPDGVIARIRDFAS